MLTVSGEVAIQIVLVRLRFPIASTSQCNAFRLKTIWSLPTRPFPDILLLFQTAINLLMMSDMAADTRPQTSRTCLSLMVGYRNAPHIISVHLILASSRVLICDLATLDTLISSSSVDTNCRPCICLSHSLTLALWLFRHSFVACLPA